jgi:hypothetical protein
MNDFCCGISGGIQCRNRIVFPKNPVWKVIGYQGIKLAGLNLYQWS